MKVIFNAVATLLITVLATVIAAVFQNDIAAALGKAPMEISYEVSKFYPYPKKNPKNKYPHEDTYSYLISMHVSITNLSGKEINSAVLYTGLEFGDFDAMQVRDGVPARFERDIRRYKVGNIAPGDKVEIFAWSETAFETYSSNKTFLVTDYGKFSFNFNYIPYSQSISTFELIDEYVFNVMFTLVCILSVILMIITYAYEAYCKHLLVDEDFYLNESVRFMSMPKKFSPADPPQSTQNKLKALEASAGR